MKIKSSQQFLVGFFIVLAIVALLYWFLPRVDFLGGSRVVYGPREAVGHVVESDISFTNVDLLVRIGPYVLGYWLFFAIAYLIAGRRRSLHAWYVKRHLILSFCGSALLIVLNKDIVFTYMIQSTRYLSDVYIGANWSAHQIAESEKESIVQQAILNLSSLLGIFLLLIGSILFARNVKIGAVENHEE